MKLALAQMQMSLSLEENYKKTRELIAQAAAEGADLILFPEVQLSPFFPQYKRSDPKGFGAADEYALKEDSAVLAGLQEACKKAGIHAAVNLYVREDGNLGYDESFLIDDEGNLLGTQKMQHIANAPQFYEQDYYRAGKDGLKVFDTKFGKIGIVVCFDRHYPDSVRAEALQGADLVLIPTANITSEPLELFQLEVKTQAARNSVNIAMCNRVGMEGDVLFAGESVVVNCFGNTIALAPSALGPKADVALDSTPAEEDTPVQNPDNLFDACLFNKAYPFDKPGSELSSGYVPEDEDAEDKPEDVPAEPAFVPPSVDPRAVAPSAPPVVENPFKAPVTPSVFDAETLLLADVDLPGAAAARARNPFFQ